MRLSEYASTQRTYGSRKVPRSVQQSIPIDQIYEDGTWRCGNVYSQMWSMPDINFTMSDEDNKAKILNLLGKVYMGVPSDCWLKICIVSQRMDEKSFRENVLLHRNLDGLDKWRVERNRRIRQCVQDAGNVVQHKYLILSTNKQNVTDARSRLRQVQGNLLAELSNLGCTIKPMTNNERLEVLHNFFRRGEEGRFQFSFDDYGKLGNDFRNTIAPDAMRCTTQYAKIDDGFAKAMTIAQYPQQLSDNFVATLLQQVPYIVLSIDITPVETEDAMREIEASQMKIDSEKYRANRRNVENLDFMATISPRNQQQEKYTAEIRNAICEGDQQVLLKQLAAHGSLPRVFVYKHRLGNVEFFQKRAGQAGVFAYDEVARAQNFERARADVGQIPYRRGYYVEYSPFHTKVCRFFYRRASSCGVSARLPENSRRI